MNARLGLLILFASISIHSIAADYTHDVAKWIKFERPSDLSSREYETFMHSANYSRSEWVVSREGDRVTTRHGIFAVEGLAHLSMTQGSMIQLIRESGKWTFKTVAALPQAAEAVAVHPR